MTKRDKPKTFAELRAEVEAQPKPRVDSSRGPGFTLDRQLIAPDSRLYAIYEDELSAQRVSELMQTNAIVVRDNCGCMGGCPLEWIDAGDPRAQVAPRIVHPKKQSSFASVQEWRSDDGHSLVYLGGPDLSWK